MGLDKLGFQDEATSILSKWKSIPLVVNTNPVVEYQYAYPKDLMNKIADIFLLGLEESRFSIATPKRFEERNPNSVMKLLNDAWNLFWRDPDKYRGWEESTMARAASGR